MVANVSVFDVIDLLSQSLPFDAVKVAEILNTQLEPDSEDDSPVLSSFVQSAQVVDGPYESVELRIPDPSFGSDGGMLNVKLKNADGIDSDTIFQRFGLEFQQVVPSPRNPAGTPAYYNYEQPWGMLSLGVTNDDEDKFVSFIMKPNEI